MSAKNPTNSKNVTATADNEPRRTGGLIINFPVGGPEGNSFSLTPRDPSAFLVGLQTWVGDVNEGSIGIRGIKVSFSDRTEATAGDVQRDPTDTINIDQADQINNAVINAGLAVDRITIKTNQGQTFASGGPLGSPYEWRIGTGVIQGFDGRINNGILRALGVTFRNY